MKSFYMRVFSIGAALMIGAALLFAQGMRGHGGPGGDFAGLEHYADALDLTTAQQDQIKAIWQQEKATLKPLMQQMHQNRIATNSLVESGPFDQAKTQALATQHAQTEIALEVEHAKIRSEMLQVLTPDQKSKFQQLEAKHEARMQHNGPPPSNE
jgi:periplasmic protein CpxP/Spy